MAKQFEIQTVILGCLKKDPKYQKVLVEQYSGMLYAICYRYLKNAEDARDNLQESLMRIFKNLEKYNSDKGKFESWITTVTIRHCLGKLAKKKIASVSIDQLQKGQPNFDIKTEFLDSFDAQYLIKIIAELPDEYRTVFNLSSIDGYSHKEIAEILGITEVSSRTRLNRAKKMLRANINKLKEKELWVNKI